MDIIKTSMIGAETIMPQKVLRWREDERTAGKIPVWESSPEPQKEMVAQELASAGQSEQEEENNSSFETALSYAANSGKKTGQGEEFGFLDLVDMVNPLQHIPIIGHVYREITGDEIKPIAQIIGGGVFGGAAGAASALVNTVVEYETGNDVTGNIVTLAMNGEGPRYRSDEFQYSAIEKTLDDAVSGKALEFLPGTAIGFADLRHADEIDNLYERVPAAEGRTAGTILIKRTGYMPSLPAREPISSLKLDKRSVFENPATTKIY